MKKDGDFSSSSNVCLFDFRDVTDVNSLELKNCRFSNVPLLPFLDKYNTNSQFANVVAYPVKITAMGDLYKSIDEYYSGKSVSGDAILDFCRMSRYNCKQITDKPEQYVAKGSDTVGAIVLCMTADKNDNLC
jgi:hypothetical protein